LVCQGKPFIKPKNYLGAGDVGIDIGPSTIAVVSETKAQLFSDHERQLFYLYEWSDAVTDIKE
jgi:hypothetical protein